MKIRNSELYYTLDVLFGREIHSHYNPLLSSGNFWGSSNRAVASNSARLKPFDSDFDFAEVIALITHPQCGLG